MKALNSAGKAVFFNRLRGNLYKGGYTVEQVEHIETVLAACADLSTDHAAYVLATTYHEVGPDFAPKRENMNYSAARIKQVWPSRPEAVKYAKQPENLANSVYANRYGNGDFRSGDGYKYRGGGYCQVTFYDNYKKFGIEDTPEKIGEPEFAAKVMVRGMVNGLFTGRKLIDYKVLTDPQARTIINNDANLNGVAVMNHANKFFAALVAAQNVPDEGTIPVYPAIPPKEEAPSADPFVLIQQAQKLLDEAVKLLLERKTT